MRETLQHDPSDSIRGQSWSKIAWISRWALFFLWFIIVTGATVRLTGSGLGCPDWPSCDGIRPVPELEPHGMVEFFNRLVSFPTTVFSIWLLIAAARVRNIRKPVFIGAVAIVVGVLIQIVVGGLSIHTDLDPMVISSHFLISILILTAATWVLFMATWPQRRLTATGLQLTTVTLMVLFGLAAVVAGVITTASGPHSGGMEDQVVERIGLFAPAVAAHARIAYVFTVFLLVVAYQSRNSPQTFRFVIITLVLAGIQIALGQIQIHMQLAWWIVLAHVANAGLIWIAMTWTALLATYTDPSKETPDDHHRS